MIIKNSKVLKFISSFTSIHAIALYPFILIADEGNEETINHERIHIIQQKELFIIGFYLLYILFFVIGLLRYRSIFIAYSSIPFEREAYANEDDWVYTLNRKRFAWRHYISAS